MTKFAGSVLMAILLVTQLSLGEMAEQRRLKLGCMAPFIPLAAREGAVDVSGGGVRPLLDVWEAAGGKQSAL